MTLFRALRHPRFALLLTGQSLSRLGDFIFQLALAWWVLEKTGSALAMGAALTFAIVPTLIFVLAGGVAVDRFSRARILLASDLGRGLVMTVVALLAVSQRLEVWMVYGLNLLFSLADAFFQPAFTAIVPEIAPADDLTSANSLASLSLQFARVAGPALGGLLVGWGGIGLAFGLNALSFFVSALLLLPLLNNVRQPASASEAASASLWAEARAGWRLVANQPILWVSILAYALSNVLLVGPFSVGLPFLVKNFMGGDERLLGGLLTSFPLGYAASSLVLGNLPRLRRRGILIFVSLSLGGLGLAAFGLRLPVPALYLFGMLNGAALEAGNLAWTSTLQQVVPLEALGRVASIDSLGSFVLMPLGFLLTGLAVEHCGPAPVFLLFSGACAALACLPLLWAPIRQFD